MTGGRDGREADRTRAAGGPESGLRIRPLRESDIEPLADIESRSFSMPWTAEDFRSLLQKTDAAYLVAEVDGMVAGSAGMRLVCGEGDIDNVVVDLPFRQKGVGRALLEALLRMGEEQGIRDFTLEVRASNKAAIRLYEKAGFVCEGVRPGYYEKPREDARIYWRRGTGLC